MKYCILIPLSIYTIFVFVRFVKGQKNIYLKSGIGAVICNALLLLFGIIISIFI